MIRSARNLTPAEHSPFIRNVFQVYEDDAEYWHGPNLKSPSSLFPSHSFFIPPFKSRSNADGEKAPCRETLTIKSLVVAEISLLKNATRNFHYNLHCKAIRSVLRAVIISAFNSQQDLSYRMADVSGMINNYDILYRNYE